MQMQFSALLRPSGKLYVCCPSIACPAHLRSSKCIGAHRPAHVALCVNRIPADGTSALPDLVSCTPSVTPRPTMACSVLVCRSSGPGSVLFGLVLQIDWEGFPYLPATPGRQVAHRRPLVSKGCQWLCCLDDVGCWRETFDPEQLQMKVHSSVLPFPDFQSTHGTTLPCLRHFSGYWFSAGSCLKTE